MNSFIQKIKAALAKRHIVENILADFHSIEARLVASAKHFESEAVTHIVAIEKAAAAKLKAEEQSIKASKAAEKIRALLG